MANIVVTMTKKIVALDSLRGIAAMIVVFTHIVSAFFPELIFGSADSVKSRIFMHTPMNLFINGGFAVVCFFVLSGFVLTMSINKPKIRDGIIITRYIRLAIVAALSVITAYFLSRLHLFRNTEASAISGSSWLALFWNNPTTLPQSLFEGFVGIFVKASTVSSLNPVMWTIYFELTGSFIVYGLYHLLRNRPGRYTSYLILFLAFSNTFYAGFIAGMFLADLYINKNYIFIKISQMHFVYKFCLILSAIIFSSVPSYTTDTGSLFGSLLIGVDTSYSIRILYILGSCIIIASILSFSKIERLLTFKPLVMLGAVSYSLYAFHLILLGSLGSYLYIRAQNISGGSHISVAVAIALYLAFTLAFSYLVMRFIDKPSINISKRIGTRLTS